MKTDRQTDRQTEIDRDRQAGRQADRQRERNEYSSTQWKHCSAEKPIDNENTYIFFVRDSRGFPELLFAGLRFLTDLGSG